MNVQNHCLHIDCTHQKLLYVCQNKTEMIEKLKELQEALLQELIFEPICGPDDLRKIEEFVEAGMNALIFSNPNRFKFKAFLKYTDNTVVLLAGNLFTMCFLHKTLPFLADTKLPDEGKCIDYRTHIICDHVNDKPSLQRNPVEYVYHHKDHIELLQRKIVKEWEG